MRTPLLALLLVVLLLAGCVQADETWTIDEKGGGTWSLVLKWNADLWRRAEGIVGRTALDRLAGRGFPLKAAEWRDAVEGLEGLTLEEATEKDLDGGVRELTVRLRFRSVPDLLRCEVLDARRIRIHADPPEVGTETPSKAAFEMRLDREIPVLDGLAGLAAARQRADEGTPGAEEVGLGPTPLQGLGVSEADATMLARMLAPALAQVRIALRVEVPGRVLRVGDEAPRGSPTEAEAAFDFLHLKRGADRVLRFEWQPRAFDVVPEVDHR